MKDYYKTLGIPQDASQEDINTFLELGKAFDCEIPILLMDSIPEMMYTEEIKAMQPIVIGTDFSLLEKIMRKK